MATAYLVIITHPSMAGDGTGCCGHFLVIVKFCEGREGDLASASSMRIRLVIMTSPLLTFMPAQDVCNFHEVK